MTISKLLPLASCLLPFAFGVALYYRAHHLSNLPQSKDPEKTRSG
ncbi:hypothetical protein [Moorena sp. SIOASIH]|nr:hypothetical protein [Moorena sp. SIOASIH]